MTFIMSEDFCFKYLYSQWYKTVIISTKRLGGTTVCNIDNNQKYFSSKSAYYYDFWRSRDTEDLSIDAENTDLITEINNSLQYIYIENCYFQLNNCFTILQFLLYFFIKAMSRKDFFWKHDES